MIARLILPLALLAASADAQVVQTAPPPLPSPVAWRCLAQIEPGPGGIYASRELDADGRFVNEGASWSEAKTARAEPRLELSVQWHRDQREPLTYGRGWASFYVTTAKPVARPTKFRLIGTDPARAMERDAGYSYIRTDNIVSNFQLDMLEAAAGGGEAFDWSFWSGRRVIQTGRLPMARFRELSVKIPQARALLDAAAADYRTRCKAVR